MSTAAGNVAVHLGADSVSLTSTESVFQALDGNVPDALKQKIINGEYIDLASYSNAVLVQTSRGV